MLYFAYGSNLDWKQMKNRCLSARFVCVAKLEGHRLAFTRYSPDRNCGVADAFSDNKKSIWGVVYQIDELDIGKLDENEGYKPGRPREMNAYVREECHVLENGEKEKPLTVFSYFVVNKETGHFPNEDYKLLVVNGACYWHLPDDYISQLKRIEIK